MFAGPFRQRPTPRHLVGAVHSTPTPVGDVALEADELEVAPLARVHRSRLAFAVAVTVAALPLIVLDNLPAIAETNDARVEVQASAADESSSSGPATTATTAPSTITTEAPTTTVAPETTTTEAPTTTEAAVVQALRAPAPPPRRRPARRRPPPPRPAPVAPTPTILPPGIAWPSARAAVAGTSTAATATTAACSSPWPPGATWAARGYPHQASKAEQIKRGKILQTRAGWGQWPSCSQKL